MKGARSNGKEIDPPTQKTPPTPPTLGLKANASKWGDVVTRGGGGCTYHIIKPQYTNRKNQRREVRAKSG